MSPVPSTQVVPTDFSYTTGVASIDVAPLPFNHLPVTGVFFAVLVIVLVAGVIAYALFKFCRPGRSTRTTLRPLLLPKLVPAEEAVAAIAAKTLFVANHHYQGFIAYTTDANGVKKSVRIRNWTPVCFLSYAHPYR